MRSPPVDPFDPFASLCRRPRPARVGVAWVAGLLGISVLAVACVEPPTSKGPAAAGVDSGPSDSAAPRDSAAPASWRSALYPEGWAPGFAVEGWALQDFSYAGYAAGERPPPELRAPPWSERWVEASAYGVDPTGVADSAPGLTAAIAAASAAGGGVVHLGAGDFRLEAPIELRHPELFLLGEGPEQTRLFWVGVPDMGYRSHLSLRGEARLGAEVPLTADGAPFEIRLQVADPSAFAPGDRVQVGQLISDAWVLEHGMDGYWGFSRGQWRPFYRRTVTAVDLEAGTISIDVPLRYPLRLRDGASVRVVEGALREVGVVGLSLSDATDWSAAWANDQTHVLGLYNVEDAIVSEVHSYASPVGAGPDGAPGGHHLQSSGVLVEASRRVTVERSAMGFAQHRGPGGNGYLFELRQSNEVLIADNHGEAGRHNFIQNWDFGTSGCVFLRNRSVGAESFTSPTDSRGLPASSETHHALATANLFDSNEIHDGWKSVNRLAESSGAGHTATESVYWNNVGDGALTSFQYGRGYVIGTTGLRVQTEVLEIYESLGTAPEDWTEGLEAGAQLDPPSLFEDQRARRLGAR